MTWRAESTLLLPHRHLLNLNTAHLIHSNLIFHPLWFFEQDLRLANWRTWSTREEQWNLLGYGQVPEQLFIQLICRTQASSPMPPIRDNIRITRKRPDSGGAVPGDLRPGFVEKGPVHGRAYHKHYRSPTPEVSFS